MFVISYCFKEGDIMGIKPFFSSEVLDKSISLYGKRYSDLGMMWCELSKKTGIDLEILQSYDDWYILEDEFYYYKNKFYF